MHYLYPAHKRATAPIRPDVWFALRSQILLQWQRIHSSEIDVAGPDRRRIAELVKRKYGIAADVVEIYLRHFEHIIPRLAA